MSQRVDVGQVVDGHHVEVGTCHKLAESETANAAKSIDSNALHEMYRCCCWFKMKSSNGEDSCNAHFVFVDAALHADGTVKRCEFNVVVDDARHDTVMSLAQRLHRGDAKP